MISKLINKIFRKSDDENTSRIFFHDLINQTHGLKLFLEGKLLSAKDISNTEIEAMYRELLVLEKMAQQHFKQAHQNLDQQDLIDVEYLRLEINKMIKTYFGLRTKYSVTIEGFEEGIPFHLRTIKLVPHSIVHRSIRNILKNAHDAGSYQVDISLQCSNNHLKIEIRNFFSKQISNNKDNREHLGLNAIRTLVESVGGEVEFVSKESSYISRLNFPVVLKSTIQEAA